jgi:hypothetical protein
MQFEEAELGVKQSGGVHGETEAQADPRPRETSADGSMGRRTEGKSHPRYARESLPPAWGSLGALKPGWISSFPAAGESGEKGEEEDQRKVDEREVRKNGQWVHQRR